MYPVVLRCFTATQETNGGALPRKTKQEESRVGLAESANVSTKAWQSLTGSGQWRFISVLVRFLQVSAPLKTDSRVTTTSTNDFYESVLG